jgi:tetratricopeptide (TPR) repeat protein
VKFILLEEIAEYRANKLEARIGQMRSLSKLQRPDQTIDAAERVLASDKVTRETQQEAYLMIARSALYKNDLEMAEEYFTKTDEVAENIMSAEAKYNLAYLEFRNGNYEQTEQMIFDYINPLTPYDYWLAKIFILLADNYLVMENIFQARHTLQSIVDNYQGEELRQIAINKLAEIDRQEAMLNEQSTQDTLEVDFQ